MAVRQELWCSDTLPAVRSLRSKSPRYDEHRSKPLARLAAQNSGANSSWKWKIVRHFVVAVSSVVKPFRPEDHPSRRELARRDSAACANDGPGVVQRREVMQICLFSGLFISDLLLQQNEAVAASLEGDNNDVRAPQSPPEVVVGLEYGRVRSCEGSAPCVSTSAFRSPSRFMPPWSVRRQYLGPQKDAYGELLKALKRMGAEVMKTEEGRYVYATMSTSSSREDIDDLEFLFVDKVVCFRSLSRKTALDPPFCWWPGCINGPRNRGRMEALRDDLGWIPLETDEDKVWTPIFLH